MQQQPDSLLLPFIKASGIHLLMFTLLLSSFQSNSTEQPLELEIKSAPVIKATAVSSETVDKLVKQQQQEIAAAQKAKRDREKRIRKQAERAAEKKKKAARDKRRKKAAEELKRKNDADKKRRSDAEKKRKAEAEKQRKIADEKKRKKDAEMKRKADAEKKRIADDKKRRQQQLENEMQAQMEAELNAAKERQILSELQKYVALIKNKISRNWIVVNQSGKCILEVKLAVGGLVIDVREIGGLPAICRSAKAAVYKSDPLPVSKDPQVFNKMRTLRLNLDPEEM